MPVIIVWAKIAFAEAAHSCGAANKKAFIDRNRSRFVGTAGCERVDDAGTRAERDRGLMEPPLERSSGGLVFHYTWSERLGSKRKIVPNAHRAPDIFDIAAKRVGSQVHC